MKCRDVRDLADSLTSEDPAVKFTEEVRRHLSKCPACRTELEMRQTLRESLRTAFQRAEPLRVRPEFVARLTQDLRAQAQGRRRSIAWRLLPAAVLAAAAMCVLVIGLETRDLVAARRFTALAQEAVGDHQNCLANFRPEHRPMSLLEAGRRFGAFYSALSTLAPSGSESDNEAMTVVARHACSYHGRRFAHVVVRYRGVLGSVLVTNSADIGTRNSEVLHLGGLSVVSFAASHHAVFVVCPLGDAGSRDLADAFQEPVRQALAGF